MQENLIKNSVQLDNPQKEDLISVNIIIIINNRLKSIFK